ncbi:MAG TPA: hypothetical protein VHO47_02365 [Candidatus Babeliales bacterium]|nr:hypothetical protein [Candidatus Babeliales bacterium]
MKTVRLALINAVFLCLFFNTQALFSIKEEESFIECINKNLLIANSSNPPSSEALLIGHIEIPRENDTILELSKLYKKNAAEKLKAHQDPIKKAAAHYYDQAEVLALSALCKKESILVMNQLIQIVTKLFDLLEYWQKINNRPVLYFATHWPTKFFEKKPLVLIANESIKNIKEALYYYTYFLGNIYRTTHKLNRIKAEDEFRAHLAKTAFLINTCLNHETFEESQQDIALSSEQLHELLMRNYDIATHFETTALLRLSKHKSPSHFERNWLKYTIGAAATLGGLIYYKTHQEQITQTSAQTLAAVKKLVQTNLVEPLKNIFDAYFSKQNSEVPTEFELKTESINNKYLTTKYPQKSADEIKKLAHEMTLKRDSSQLKDDIDFAYNNPGKAWYYGSITAPLIEIRMEALNAIDAVRHGLNQNHVNFNLAMTLPAIAILGGLYVLYRQVNRFSKDILSDKHRNPVREGLINIENTLNKFNKPNSSVPFEAEGLILYWLSKLRCYAPHIPEHHSAQFEEDLSQISSPDFELGQKLSTLERMHRTYEFLGFGPQRKLFYSYGAQSFLNSTVNRERSLFSGAAL